MGTSNHRFILFIGSPLLPGLGFGFEPVETPGPINYMNLLESLIADQFSNADTILQLTSLLKDRISLIYFKSKMIM